MKGTLALADQSRNYLDGEWMDSSSGSTIESVNPSVPDEIIATFPKSRPDEARRAVEAADAAQREWEAKSAHTRGDIVRDAARIIDKRQEEIAQLLAHESGKRIGPCRSEVQRVVDIFEYYSELGRENAGSTKPSQDAGVFTYTKKEAWGTASVVTPWNFPLAIPAWKIAPALVTGNTVVFKPASFTPASAAVLVDALDEAGLPSGVVNFVTGSGSTVGSVLTEHEKVDLVSFTGSYSVGNSIYTSATNLGKRVQCEMGGKNPLLVDDDADLELAVDLTISGAFSFCGQKCTATSRAIVHEDVHDEYVEQLIDRTESLTVGSPLKEETDMGPAISRNQLEENLEYIEIGQEEGATLATGGSIIDREGYFLEPTVFTDVKHDMRIAQEEIFGPVLSVIEAGSFDKAVDIANDIPFGLVASLCTNNLHRAQDFVDRSETGVVKINEPSIGVELQMPFGGRKNSGTETFKEQGRKAFDFFTHEKTVYQSTYEG